MLVYMLVKDCAQFCGLGLLRGSPTGKSLTGLDTVMRFADWSISIYMDNGHVTSAVLSSCCCCSPREVKKLVSCIGKIFPIPIVVYLPA